MRALALLSIVVACRCGAPPESAPGPASDGATTSVTAVVLRLSPQAEGGWRVAIDGERPRELTVPPVDAELSALADSLARRHPPALSSVVVEVAGVPLPVVESVAAALRRRGFAAVKLARAAGAP